MQIERLKRRNKKLEEDQEQTQARFNETCSSTNTGGGMTLNFKEFNQLRAELDSANGKMKKMKECFKAASKEFRDVCYMLLGYRIDRVGPNSHYR